MKKNQHPKETEEPLKNTYGLKHWMIFTCTFQSEILLKAKKSR